MPALSQESRFISINTPVGANELVISSFSGTEYLSKPFNFRVELLSQNHDIKANDLLGKTVDIELKLSSGESRYFNAYVSQFSAGGRRSGGYRSYSAELVPWFQLLTLYSDCKIFQNKKADAIIKDVFGERGFSDFEVNTTGTFKEREYTVQYRETDFQFVSRLMEEEGMFYYFKHEQGRHVMVIGDSSSAYEACAESEAMYVEGEGYDDRLTQWENEASLVSGKWSQKDYNFETPSTNLFTTVSTVLETPGLDKFEQYDYPGLYRNKNEGDTLTRIRMEEEESFHNEVNASGNYRSFFAGGTFSIGEHIIASEEGKSYVITSISHQIRESNYELGESGGFEYVNDFQCIPDSVKYRPPQTTRKPFVQGPQTAVVVGPSGEEIYVDEYGRIKVQFHWDRVGKKDDKSSCWIRVSQQWAGQKWGAIFTPRIGHEVIVSFLEGDPDQPIVTGCVYNAENMPPYDLPANKTQSGWKTRSSKSGGTANFNELRFEDKKGSEEIYIHAEKDQNNVVENDETTEVGNDRTENVGNNETIEIGNNRTEKVGKDEKITIGANRNETVADNEDISIGKDRTENVGKNEKISIGDNQTINIGKEQSVDIGTSLAISIGKNRGVDVGDSDSLSVGKKLTIEAGDQITIKTGKASITMKKNGDITIKGKNLTLNGSGKINAKASSDVIIKGSKVGLN